MYLTEFEVLKIQTCILVDIRLKKFGHWYRFHRLVFKTIVIV